MLGGQTLIKKGHRQNHQMTAVRKNPLRLNNPKNSMILKQSDPAQQQTDSNTATTNNSGQLLVSPTKEARNQPKTLNIVNFDNVFRNEKDELSSSPPVNEELQTEDTLNQAEPFIGNTLTPNNRSSQMRSSQLMKTPPNSSLVRKSTSSSSNATPSPSFKPSTTSTFNKFNTLTSPKSTNNLDVLPNSFSGGSFELKFSSNPVLSRPASAKKLVLEERPTSALPDENLLELSTKNLKSNFGSKPTLNQSRRNSLTGTVNIALEEINAQSQTQSQSSKLIVPKHTRSHSSNSIQDELIDYLPEQSNISHSAKKYSSQTPKKSLQVPVIPVRTHSELISKESENESPQTPTSKILKPELTVTPTIQTRIMPKYLEEKLQLKALPMNEVFPNGVDASNKKIKLQVASDKDLSYLDVTSELKTLISRFAMFEKSESGKQNSFKNLYNFSNDSEDIAEIQKFETDKMEKRIKRLKYYRKILKTGLLGWNDYRNERESYVAIRKSSLMEEGILNDMSKEEEELEMKRFDEEYRRFQQRKNPEIPTKVSKAIEKVDPQSAAISILESLSQTDRGKTEVDKKIEREKLTAEITRWKKRWSPMSTPTGSGNVSLTSSTDLSESVFEDGIEFGDDDDDESEAASDKEDEDDNFEIIILNDLQSDEDEGFFLTSTASKEDEKEEEMLNKVDPKKLLRAIVGANSKKTLSTSRKPNPPSKPLIRIGHPSIQPDDFEMKFNVRESRAISHKNTSRYQEDAPNSPAHSNPFDLIPPPVINFMFPSQTPPSNIVRQSRLDAMQNGEDLLKYSEDPRDSLLTDSVEHNDTLIDWKKEAGMLKQKRKSSFNIANDEDGDDLVLMNEDEKPEVVLSEKFSVEERKENEKQQIQFNQLLQHLNSELEFSEKFKKKKKKKKKQAEEVRPESPKQREETDLIEEDNNITITNNQQDALSTCDKSKKLIIELDELLGIGAHGKVYKGFIPNLITNTKDPVAIKKLSVKAGRFSKKFIKLEVDILRQLYHPFLVQYLGCKYSSSVKEYSIVLEYVDGGTLESWIKINGPLDEESVSIVVAQVLMGLEYLHSKRIIHRDLKPANILISSSGVVKITDFGVSTQLLNIEAVRTSCVGTPHYSAPEVIMVKPYSFTADIWSLGCVVFELLFGKRPYNEFNQVAAMYHMVEDEKPPIPPNNFSPACMGFLDACWTKDWKKRPNSRELQSHPFVNHSSLVVPRFVKNIRKSILVTNPTTPNDN